MSTDKNHCTHTARRKFRWLAMLMIPLLLFVGCFPWHMFHWSEREPMTLPDGNGELTLLNKGLHPFLAESSRRIHINTPSIDTTVDLPINVGGQDVIDVYWYPVNGQTGPFVRLVDHWGEYLLDLSIGRSYSLMKVDGVLFAGDTTNSDGAFQWIGDEFNGQPALKMEGPVADSEGQHLGSFK